ncbi:MAG: metalloregulator ArsR/SmtB family transcription factor [Hyphomicrobium sp.]|uniref:ArsR/SmtB family transcription factor n=1 Tax=Hyphomicrobium sp. TaxID=82 RepID=UPI0025B9E344|nr:metalloregulator ArsR/SmtB family transcription factor [Hyphomicrobium sp.]MBX9863940.1 metalloregulator ArsR/SmtB family transcription factor [Hyphomicrobium sp.]
MSCADIMKALSDKTRLAVVEQLFFGARRVNEINSELNLEPTLFSHHLRVLRQAGIVVTRREGKSIVYSLSPAVTNGHTSPVLDFGCCTLSFNIKSEGS